MSTSASSQLRIVKSLSTLGYRVYTTCTGAYCILLPAHRRGEQARVIAVLDVRLAETNILLVHELDITRDSRTPQQGCPSASDILLGFWKHHIGLGWSALAKIVFKQVKEFYLCDLVPSLYRRMPGGRVSTLACRIIMGRPDTSYTGGGDILSNAIIRHTQFGRAVAAMVTEYHEKVGGIEGFQITPLIDLRRFRRERCMRDDQQISEQDISENFDLEVFIGQPATPCSNHDDGDNSSFCSEEDDEYVPLGYEIDTTMERTR